MTQLNRIEERQISIENKADENARAIKQLMQKSAKRRPVKPPAILFRTVNNFLAFEKVDEEIYSDLVEYFIYLGRANPVDCAAEYFRCVFPEDEEVSSHLTLNGKTGPGGCKLRDSRFAQAYQDAINVNKHFPNTNNVAFHEALEKALKSLKTRKWRYNRKRHEPLCEENDLPRNRRRRMNNPKEEEDEDTDEPEEIQHAEEAEDNDFEDVQDMDEAEYSDETEYNTDDGPRPYSRWQMDRTKICRCR